MHISARLYLLFNSRYTIMYNQCRDAFFVFLWCCVGYDVKAILMYTLHHRQALDDASQFSSLECL